MAMDTTSGKIERVSDDMAAKLAALELEAHRAGQLPRQIVVSDGQAVMLRGMNRHERRAWARQEAKRRASGLNR